MKTPLRLLPILLCLSLATAAPPDEPLAKYSEVRVFARTESDFRRIMDAGLYVDHANTKPGYYSDAWLSQSEIELLKKSGVPFETLIDDWDAYYRSLPVMTPTEMQEAIRQSAEQYNVSHSIYGSMGGYLTYAEVVAKLDSMRLEYPEYISEKSPIGTTWEGRTIWVARITKNPDVPSGRPEVLYHAVIHAREPESMETQFYYFYWLFENYGVDPLATYILDNREVYWVPVLNPDGYVHNQTTNPGGGGMWRENRRFNSGTCYGVDLNRNYGTYQFWNSPNGGSSTTPTCGSGTYRGPSPFSEPETQAIRDFINSRNLNASFGAHTYGNYLIKPWAWSDPSPTPDDNKFNQYLADMKASNPVYTTGTPSETVGYEVRGSSDDWYYNDSVHTGHHIIAITPETGNSFWPAQSQIIPLAQGMLYNNQYMTLIAGPFVNPLSKNFDQPTYTPGQSGTYKVVFRNKGVMDASNVTVLWTSSSPQITIPATEFTYPSLASFATDSALFNFSVSAFVPNNCAIPTTVTIKLDTTTVYTAPAYVLVGSGTIVLNDNGNTFSNWTTNGTWAVTTSQFNSPPSSFTDSPSGNYGNNADNSMTLASPIDAASTPILTLSFNHRYATEAGYDYCIVEVSSNNGSTWQPVTSYNGSHLAWTPQSFDITGFANASAQTKIRFRLTSDVSVTADGWYVDDIRVNGYSISPDTGLVFTPNQLAYTGPVGRVFTDSVRVYNFTPDSVHIVLAETTSTLRPTLSVSPSATKSVFSPALVQRLKHAFRKANITPASFPKGESSPPSNSLAFATIITDERDENLGAADIYRVQHQYRQVPLVGNFHDFRIIMRDVPDTAVAGFISVDTDQDFGTGAFPTPFGIGPTSRDLGSEREILFDASGMLFDSLGFGRIRAGVVLNTANDSIVGLPFLLAITRDSVLTITTNALGGIQEGWLNDADGKMNVGVVASRVNRTANPLPDFAPLVGHGTVGSESGVSWISEDKTSFAIPAYGSTTVGIRVVAAKPQGNYVATMRLTPDGRPTVSLPVSMTVLPALVPHISVTPTSFPDTLSAGDSTSHALQISNTGNGALTFGILDTLGSPWLSFTPQFGMVDTAQTFGAFIIIRTAGLAIDSTYAGQLLVANDDPSSPVVPVTFTVRVVPPVAVRETGSHPGSFALYQNYPNPFNPTTVIRYSLPVTGYVSLKIYNVLGQEVATLANGEHTSGTYRVEFRGERLASGVYYYRLQARQSPSDVGGQSGQFTQLRKMIYMK